jgi:hypothetical protein
MAEPIRAEDEAPPEDGELVATAQPDPLRAAFAKALAELIAALPPGVERDIAVAETMEAHLRAAAALARRRLN